MKTTDLKFKSNRMNHKANGVHIPNTDADLTDVELLKILLKVRNGNFSVRLHGGKEGVRKDICEVINEIIDLNERMVFEFGKVGTSIGKQGKLTNRVTLDGARGSWGTYNSPQKLNNKLRWKKSYFSPLKTCHYEASAAEFSRKI